MTGRWALVIIQLSSYQELIKGETSTHSSLSVLYFLISVSFHFIQRSEWNKCLFFSSVQPGEITDRPWCGKHLIHNRINCFGSPRGYHPNFYHYETLQLILFRFLQFCLLVVFLNWAEIVVISSSFSVIVCLEFGSSEWIQSTGLYGSITECVLIFHGCIQQLCRAAVLCG